MNINYKEIITMSNNITNDNKKTKKVKGTNKMKLQQVVGNKQMIDPNTGEVQDFTVIQKNVNQDYNFHKIWLEDLMNILNSMGNKKMTILTYLLRIMRNSDNSLNFTMRSLADDTGVSLQTCQNTIKELLEANVLKRDKRVQQLYTFNPDLIVKGGSNKRRRILIEYNYEDESEDTKRARELAEKLDNEIIDTEVVPEKLGPISQKWVEEHPELLEESKKGLGKE